MAESMPLRDSDSMANLLSSIVHSFRTVPPAAVPAMLNCIIASTGVSPCSLFDSLLRDFTSFTKDLVDDSEMLGSDQCMNLVSYLRALCHLLKKDGLDSIALESFIWHAFIRLIKIMQLYGREMLNEIIESFCEIVIATNNWEVIEATMVPFLLSSVRLFINMDKSEDTAITQRGRHSGLQDSKAQLNDVDIDSKSIISSPGGIPLTVSCQILCSLLDASVLCQQAAKGITRDIVAKGCTEEKFSGHMLSELSVIAIHMLSQSLEQRSVAVRFLLPSLFKAFAYKHSFGVSFQGKAPCISRYDFFLKLWKCSRMLFALGSVERRDAYGIISLYLSYFSCVDCPGVAAGDKAEEFDIRAEQEFWDEIKRGLVDKESLVRKQSLHILKRTLRINEGELKSDVLENKPQQKSSVPRGMTKRDVWAEKEAESLGVRQMCTPADASLNIQQKWGAFVLLYEMLEEYGTHLVEAAWNHQIRLLLHSSFQHDDFVNPAEEVNKRPVDALNMTFEWLAILWERGLSHDNPQVRCLIMQSFLEFEWKNQGKCIRTFPENFVLGPLIQGLNDPVHHKDFGLKGVYSSETIEGATRFFSQYSSYLWGREQVSFLQKLVSIGRQQCFGRAGLMSLVECISSASIPSAVCKSDIQDQSSSEVNCCLDALSDVNGVALIETQPCTDKVGLIDGLRFLIENSRQHFNPKYRLRVCEKIMKAAASIVCTHELPLEILSHFVSALPREFTDSGGPLRVKVQEWLAGCGKRDCSVNCANNEMQVLQNLWDFPRKFIKHHYSASTLGYFDDEDLVAWGSELGRWARVLFLLIKADHDLGPLFMFIKGNSCICGKNNHDDLMPVKFLMLVLSLVHELQVFQRRIVDRMNAPEAWPIVEKFIEVFLVVLEGLVSFADSSCSIFWSTMVEEDTALPGAVIGKLGGPSQRRLSSRTTTAVLQAIVLIRTVASVSSWCASVRRDAAFDHALTFLWRFFQRVVSSPMCDSPTKAEIHLAEFEALSFILKALVPVFSSSAMTVIKEINALLEPAAEDVPLLDALVLTFLEHVNSFLAVGLLARTRKAVLMNWKWICLESLLSIPYYSSENEVQLECGNPLFSDGAVRCIFGDLVESLENAGEDSVLSMLRSVRMVLDLLTSGSSFISSCNGLDLQMMWQLVRSTWILHISCNKRRVASIAALLSSVLHASVFGDENMHIGNSSPGPLKWFCEKVLEEGTKSPRTIRLAALHLAGLWLSNPGMIKYYMKELKILTLYGSVAFDEDFEAELSENDDARTEVTLLAKVPDSEMTQEFINTELYARVSVAVLFHKLADLAEFVGSGNETDDCHAALVSGKLLLLELLDSAVNDRDLAKELYKKYSAIHRRKIRAWQMICVLSRFVRQDIVQQVKQSLSICLYRNNMPAVRQYLETFAISVYLKFPSLVGEHLVPIFYDYDMRTQALSSYVFIAANVILHANKAVQSKHLDELLPPIIPLLTSHHHSLRGFTQLLVYQVLSKLLPAPDSCCFETAPLEKSCFDNLRSYLALNPDCMRLRASMERFLDAFSPEDSVTPAGIFSSRIEALEFECVPVSLMERVINFLNDVREGLRSSMAKDEVTLRNESLRTKEDRNCVDLQATGGEDVLPNDISLNFQRKFTFSKHEMQENNCSSLRQLEISRPLLDMEKEDQLLEQIYRSRMTSIEKLKANRQQFILVASLLDRIPNLAGLARTCEVFKATGLVIADANVLQDKQFQLISVTAEKWIPIIEVPEKSVEIFLEKKKAEGFSILGLEQTANSISLDKYIFPQKTVLVLGREKEGIPVEIIHILDACVEIPQLGVVRSLNVHVSGAIALWEYTRQQRFK